MSLKAANGGWRTTLDLSLGNDNIVSVSQHRGVKNQEIIKQAKQIEKWLVQGINARRITINAQAIEEFRAERERERQEDRHEELLVKIGFDPFDVESSDNAFHAWRSTLGSIFPHKPSRSEYLHSIGLNSFVENAVQEYSQRSYQQLRYG